MFDNSHKQFIELRDLLIELHGKVDSIGVKMSAAIVAGTAAENPVPSSPVAPPA